MSALPVTRRSRAEYLRQERLAEFRSEYHRGEVVAMAGASLNHTLIVSNLTRSLGEQLRDRPCNAYPSDLRVSVQGGERYLYPDVIVACGRLEFEDDKHDTLLNPLAIVEVLSPSTEAYDRGGKFLLYQSIASLREYVLVSQATRRLEVFRRQLDGSWLYESSPFSPPPLILRSIDCTLTIEEVYLKVEEEPGG